MTDEPRIFRLITLRSALRPVKLELDERSTRDGLAAVSQGRRRQVEACASIEGPAAVARAAHERWPGLVAACSGGASLNEKWAGSLSTKRPPPSL